MTELEREERVLELVDRWHEGDGRGMEIHEYLGVDPAEYVAWAEGRASLLIPLRNDR